jgi:phage tail-like protein
MDTSKPLLTHMFSVECSLGSRKFPEIGFQKVSGLRSSLTFDPLNIGGGNTYPSHIVRSVKHDDLILERGMALKSELSSEIEKMFSSFNFTPFDILITAVDPETNPPEPIAAWSVRGAYPIEWSLSDFDAVSPAVIIESLKFKYTTLEKKK